VVAVSFRSWFGRAQRVAAIGRTALCVSWRQLSMIIGHTHTSISICIAENEACKSARDRMRPGRAQKSWWSRVQSRRADLLHACNKPGLSHSYRVDIPSFVLSRISCVILEKGQGPGFFLGGSVYRGVWTMRTDCFFGRCSAYYIC